MTESTFKARLLELGASDWTYELTGGLVCVDKLQPAEPINFLFRYLVASGFIVSASPADA